MAEPMKKMEHQDQDKQGDDQEQCAHVEHKDHEGPPGQQHHGHHGYHGHHGHHDGSPLHKHYCGHTEGHHGDEHRGGQCAHKLNKHFVAPKMNEPCGHSEEHHGHDQVAPWHFDPDKDIPIEYWEGMGHAGYSAYGLDVSLEKYYEEKLLCGKEKIKVLVPCCGNMYEMKWLYDKGHTVVGVDIGGSALKAFFDQHSMEYTTTPLEGIHGNLMKNKDGRIRLYECNIFNFGRKFETDFDAVFDKIAFDHINKSEREKYGEVILDVLAPTGRIMLVTLEWDMTLHQGPPHSIPEFVIHDVYGAKCNIEQLVYQDVLNHEHNFTKLKTMYEKVHIISPKAG